MRCEYCGRFSFEAVHWYTIVFPRGKRIVCEHCIEERTDPVGVLDVVERR